MVQPFSKVNQFHSYQHSEEVEYIVSIFQMGGVEVQKGR